LEIRIWDLFRVSGFEFRIYSCWFQILDSEFWILDSGLTFMLFMVFMVRKAG